MLQKWEISASLMGHKAHMKNYWHRLVFRSQSDLVEGNLYLNDFLIPRLFFTQRAILWVPPHYLLYYLYFLLAITGAEMFASVPCRGLVVLLEFPYQLFPCFFPILYCKIVCIPLFLPVPRSIAFSTQKWDFFILDGDSDGLYFFFWGMWSIGQLTPKKNCSQELIIVSPGAGGWGWFLPKQKIDAITSQRL